GGENNFRATGAYPKGTECAPRAARDGSLAGLDLSCRLCHHHSRASLGCKTCCGSSLKAPPGGCETTFTIAGVLGPLRPACSSELALLAAARRLGKALGR